MAIMMLAKSAQQYAAEMEMIGHRIYAPLNCDLTSTEVEDVFGNFDRLVALAQEFSEALIYRQARYRDYVHQVGDLLLAWIPRLQDPYIAYLGNKYAYLCMLV